MCYYVHMNKTNSNHRAFTLVELLVVIFIITILSAMIYRNIGSARIKSRDAKRISNVAQLQLSLEQYFDRNKYYPTALSQLTPTYISVLPSGIYNVDYAYYTSGSRIVDYILHSQLEGTNEVVKDGLASFPGTSGWTGSFSCSNLASSQEYCVGPK